MSTTDKSSPIWCRTKLRGEGVDESERTGGQLTGPGNLLTLAQALALFLSQALALTLSLAIALALILRL